MRISTFQIHEQASQQIQTLGAQAAATQARISNGKRLTQPGDDPVGAARLVSLKQAMGAREQYLKNVASADSALALEESVLKQVTELFHRVQELTLQAGSGVQTPEDRAFIAGEVEARFDELVALANTKNSAGQYIFAGFRSESAPFVQDSQGVEYHGDEGQRRVDIEQGQWVTLNDAGDRVFMDIAAQNARLTLADTGDAELAVSDMTVVDQAVLNDFFPDDLVIEFSDQGGGLNYSVVRASDRRVVAGLANIPYSTGAQISAAGVSFELAGAAQAGDQVLLKSTHQQSIFNTVQNLAEGLRSYGVGQDDEAFRALIDDTIAGLDNATEVVLGVRADLGTRFSSLEAAKDLHNDVILQLDTLRSEIEDLDFAEAVSDLAFQSFVLEAAQQSFLRINRLSLFDRL